MKRILLIAMLLALPVLATAQMPGPGMGFVTTADRTVVTPGTTLTLTATFTYYGQMPMQVADDALFVIGLRYGQPGPLGMFVDPIIPLGLSKFTETQQGNLHIHTAKFKFAVPSVQLPPNFSSMFYFQAVTLVKPLMWPQPRLMPAWPAPVALTAKT